MRRIAFFVLVFPLLASGQGSFSGKFAGQIGGTAAPPLFSDGFESGGFSSWNAIFGNPSPFINSNSVYVKSGSYSMGQEYRKCGISAPGSAPALSETPGGSLGARTYYVKYTYNDNVIGTGGISETLPSSEQSIAVDANNLLVVTSPSSQALLAGWHVYVSTTTGTETRQTGTSPVNVGTHWTEPAGGLVSGAALPGTSVCGNAHEDSGIFAYHVESGNGLDHFFIRGYVYLKTPESDATPGTWATVNRKLLYLKAKNWNASWAFVVGFFGGGQLGPAASLRCGLGTQTFYEDFYFSEDQWYELELELQANTPGSSDGYFNLWVNSVLRSSHSGLNIRDVCTDGITGWEVGEQADRFNFDVVHEMRYWDDVVISNSRIGP